MQAWSIKIFYDGTCPFCAREVAWLKRRDSRNVLRFEDFRNSEFDCSRYDRTIKDFESVIHGELPDGTIVTRLEVFQRAYSAIGLEWIVAPTRWPILAHFFDWLYGLFARYRLSLGKLAGRDCEGGCRI
jgi:predicted DCC family thiol-disulfide oxidoreductase YuxK